MRYFILTGIFVLGQYSSARMCGNYNVENPGPTPLVAPAKPVPANCEARSTDDSGQIVVTMDQACLASNQVKERDYQYQSGCFSQANQVQQGIIQAAAADAERQRQAAASAQAQAASAKAAAEAAQKQNQKGSAIYQLASIGAGIASAYYVSLMPSCTGPQAAACLAPLIAKAAFFAAMAVTASGQKSSHDSVASAACETAARMASEGSGGCGPAPSPYNPQTYPQSITSGQSGTPTVGTIFDANGKCIGSAADCEAIVSGLPPGVSIKEGIKGLNSFAESSGKVFKVDKDGNIITKDGKKYSAADLSNEKSLVAAGLSAAEAKSLLAHINKAGSVFDAKAALAKENTKDSNGGAFGDAGGSLLKGNAQAANGAAGGGKNIGGGRDPASAEGLAKDFNGDMIGVAGDDIFKMMNRRYKLKSSQDNFIAP